MLIRQLRGQAELEESLEATGTAPVVHQAPFYGNPADVPERPPVWAGLEFRVPSVDAACLPPFRPGQHPRPPHPDANPGQRLSPLRSFCPVARPPSRAETDAWLAAERVAGQGPGSGSGGAGSAGAAGAGAPSAA